jgi:hypothetical protein
MPLFYPNFLSTWKEILLENQSIGATRFLCFLGIHVFILDQDFCGSGPGDAETCMPRLNDDHSVTCCPVSWALPNVWAEQMFCLALSLDLNIR